MTIPMSCSATRADRRSALRPSFRARSRRDPVGYAAEEPSGCAIRAIRISAAASSSLCRASVAAAGAGGRAAAAGLAARVRAAAAPAAAFRLAAASEAVPGGRGRECEPVPVDAAAPLRRNAPWLSRSGRSAISSLWPRADRSPVRRSSLHLAIDITESLRELEGDLGFPLLDRRPRGVTPTLKGRQFLRHAEKILADVANAQPNLQGETTAASPGACFWA